MDISRKQVQIPLLIIIILVGCVIYTFNPFWRESQAFHALIRYPDPNFQSVQEAVNHLQPGGRLIISDGIHDGGIVLNKDIEIEGESDATLRLPHASDQSQLSASGNVSVSIRNLKIEQGSILINGDAQLHLTNVELSTLLFGVLISGKASVFLENVLVRGGYIEVSERANVEIQRSRIESSDSMRTPLAIELFDQSMLILSQSIVSVEDSGIRQWDQSRSHILDSSLIENGGFGLMLSDNAQSRLENSRVAKNGHDWSADPGEVPPYSELRPTSSGIYFRNGQPRLTLVDTVVEENAGWGIGTFHFDCLLPESSIQNLKPEHRPHIVFIGAVDIANNSQLIKFEGNPGNHPFSDHPNGQICVP